MESLLMFAETTARSYGFTGSEYQAVVVEITSALEQGRQVDYDELQQRALNLPARPADYYAECVRIAQRQRRRVFLTKKNRRARPVVVRPQARREARPRERRASSVRGRAVPARSDDPDPPPDVVPRVSIVLGLEAAPRVEVETAGGSEPVRLLDWIVANPELADLLHHAVRVEADWQRRERAA